MREQANRRGQRGFSLIELMMVVAIIGLLASVAIPSFVRYVRKSRTIEAYEALWRVAEGAQVYHTQYNRLPPSTGFVPSITHAAACSSYAGVFPPSSYAGEYDNPTWKALLFHQSDAVRYRLNWTVVTNSAASVEAFSHAVGDLDCDGVLATYRVWVFRNGPGDELDRRGPYLFLGDYIE